MWLYSNTYLLLNIYLYAIINVNLNDFICIKNCSYIMILQGSTYTVIHQIHNYLVLIFYAYDIRERHLLGQVYLIHDQSVFSVASVCNSANYYYPIKIFFISFIYCVNRNILIANNVHSINQARNNS